MFYTLFEHSIGIRTGTLVWFHYLSVILDPLCLFAMDYALYASMHVLDVDECNMPPACENASMSDNPSDCDAMLHESLGVVNIPNIKLFKKKATKFHKDLSKLFLWKWWFNC